MSIFKNAQFRIFRNVNISKCPISKMPRFQNADISERPFLKMPSFLMSTKTPITSSQTTIARTVMEQLVLALLPLMSEHKQMLF